MRVLGIAINAAQPTIFVARTGLLGHSTRLNCSVKNWLEPELDPNIPEPRGVTNSITWFAESLFLIQPQEACSIVIKNVALLLRCQVLSVLDHADASRHQLWPVHLVCSEHHAILKAGLDNSLNVHIDFFDRIAPDQSRNIDVDSELACSNVSRLSIIG